MSLLELLTQYSQITNNDLTVEDTIKLNQQQDWMTPIFNLTDKAWGNNVLNNLSKNASVDELLSYIRYDIDDGTISIDDKKYQAGWFVSPTVTEIVETVQALNLEPGSFTVTIVTGEDVGLAHIQASPYTTFQAASQLNALEMINIDKTPLDGIEIYINDGTQGPRVALACACGTFVRNYWLLREYGAQFNALENFGISHLNGYLVWGTQPRDILHKLEKNAWDLMIPSMIYSQVVGVTTGREGRAIHKLDKLVHQIYNSAVPINTYRNGGNFDDQKAIAKKLIEAAYIGTIGMGIILHTLDKNAGKTLLPYPVINLTLIGNGVFGVPIDLVLECISNALAVFSKHNFDIYISAYRAEEAIRVRDFFPTYIFPSSTQAIQSRNLDNYVLSFNTDKGLKTYPLRDYQRGILDDAISLYNEEKEILANGLEITIFSRAGPNGLGREMGFIGNDGIPKTFINLRSDVNRFEYDPSTFEYTLYDKSGNIIR